MTNLEVTNRIREANQRKSYVRDGYRKKFHCRRDDESEMGQKNVYPGFCR